MSFIQLFLKQNDQAWKRFAACVGRNALFYPGRGASLDIESAQAICSACPVRGECLELGINEAFGIWGGLSLRQRRKVRRYLRNGLGLRDAVEATLHEKATWVRSNKVYAVVRTHANRQFKAQNVDN